MMPLALDLPGAPRRILAIVVTRIGDTLLCTPALRALKARWPEAELSVWAHPKRLEVLTGLPWIDHLQAYDWRCKLGARLSGRKYDLALVFSDEEDQIACARRVAPQVLAFAGKAAGAPGLTLVQQQAAHAVVARMALLAPLGIDSAEHHLAYQVSADEATWAGRRLAGCGRPLIALQLHSFPTKAHRDWPLEHFAQLVEGLRLAYPQAAFVVTGDALARDSAERLRQRCGDCVHSLAGELSLRQTAAVLAAVDLYVGVDTGPTHLAGAVGAPMVALYHAAYPGRNLSPHQHPQGRFIEHPQTGSPEARQADMADIPVAPVLQAARELLEYRA